MGQAKRVLIAHQSTIPHYRIPFYHALEQQRPATWTFEVVFDAAEFESPRFFQEQAVNTHFDFPIHPVRTYTLTVAGKRLAYQTFLRASGQADLVIVENAVNNLTYPLCRVLDLRGTRTAYWGHERHIGGAGKMAGGAKRIAESLKLMLIRRSAGFFAYTEEMRLRLIALGLPTDRVFAVNNTIDILTQRQAYADFVGQRSRFKRELGVADKRVLLFVGRFTANKRIPFLLDVLTQLNAWNPVYHLLMVGGGGEKYLGSGRAGISYFGPVTDISELARIYLAADLFAFPGATGLGPLQALCYDLPVVTIDSDTQMPEFSYLNPLNSLVLPETSSVEEYAHAIDTLFSNPDQFAALRSSAWPSISHLTIASMAQKFAAGIDTILATS